MSKRFAQTMLGGRLEYPSATCYNLLSLGWCKSTHHSEVQNIYYIFSSRSRSLKCHLRKVAPKKVTVTAFSSLGPDRTRLPVPARGQTKLSIINPDGVFNAINRFIILPAGWLQKSHNKTSNAVKRTRRYCSYFDIFFCSLLSFLFLCHNCSPSTFLTQALFLWDSHNNTKSEGDLFRLSTKTSRRAHGKTKMSALALIASLAKSNVLKRALFPWFLAAFVW